ncbi:MAG: ABC transporter ATP-binding protein [Cytophagales bacterium]|nr:ABC transporter ATP-binding protein [Bernardetiaceae bacterium]MDW8206130.1 ABC transporter ATP-binding protein [Cytophagales bacterium]
MLLGATSKMPQTLLTTANLAIGYANRILLQELNLQLQAGTITVLLGRNGIGKSTLIRTLAGLQPALKGSVRIGERLLIPRRNYEWLARQIAVTLTERPHAPFMTGYELVALGRAPYTNWTGRLTPTDHQQIERALSITDADELRNCPIEELSDGQCQKLMIARAIAQDTPLLLLDEPLAHLDLANSAQLLCHLTEYVRATGKAILMSTHQIELAIHKADFIWLIDQHNRLHSDMPEQLVLDNQIGDIFSGRQVFFNHFTGYFNFLPPNAARTIAACLHMSENSSYWLAQAFAKKGIRLLHKENAKWHIRQVHSSPHRFECQANEHIFETNVAGVVQLMLEQASLPELANF